jgi:hypothetical protein
MAVYANYSIKLSKSLIYEHQPDNSFQKAECCNNNK